MGIRESCKALNVSHSTLYRRRKKKRDQKSPKRKPGTGLWRALSEEEQNGVLEILHSEKYMDLAPREVYASLLDEGKYLCSVRTMYRLLAKNDEVRERRNHKRKNNYKKPELLAMGPNEVWTWDITKLKGPVKWCYFYLYVILDIYSRYVVGWMVGSKETGKLARDFIEETCIKQQIEKGELIIHSDRGSPMKSKTVSQLLSDLEVTRSLSRPSVSNDNPYIESHFKTLKYCPEFPQRFGCKADAIEFCKPFFNWYNKSHYHTGIGLLTPESVHYGYAQNILDERKNVLSQAYDKHPERFTNKFPVPLKLPEAVWINPPKNVSAGGDAQLNSQQGN